MRVLVACEESQEVCKAFRALGHEAYSCDIEPCSGGHPEWHIQVDALELLKMRWDMILAFPPCTYLSNAGAKHLFRGGELNQERYQMGLEAKGFFLKFLNADCPRICVENPVSSRIYEMPPHSQEVQPWMFGHPVQKKTRLWLNGLPPLEPTDIVDPECGCHEAGTWFMKGGKDRQKNRAKTFPGLAKAMAQQWGGICDYGGRGISVCEEWSDFVAFRNWALKNGYQEGLTIDRIDNDGPYSPENCRWTTKKVQNNNQSTTTIIKVGDVEKPLHIWADFIGIPPEALRRRLYDGWNVERALFEKIDTTKCPKKYRAALRREQDG